MNSLGASIAQVLSESCIGHREQRGDLMISSLRIETFYVVGIKGRPFQGITMFQRGYLDELSEPATWFSTFWYARNNAQLLSNDSSRTFMIPRRQNHECTLHTKPYYSAWPERIVADLGARDALACIRQCAHLKQACGCRSV
jgi:hypothetical protein